MIRCDVRIDNFNPIFSDIIAWREKEVFSNDILIFELTMILMMFNYFFSSSVVIVT